MKPARLPLALACALAACASPAPAPPPAAEAPAAAPLSPEQQRFENWKQSGAPADPRAGFAQTAEEEAERRRQAALARGVTPDPDSAAGELRRLQLEELVTWNGGCFPVEPDFAGQDDWIRHRALTRDDFRETEPRHLETEVEIPGGVVAAYVRIRLACVVNTRVSESPGGFTAEIVDVRFFSMLSRDESWWNPDSGGRPEWILRHEQLHFDVAELFAQEQNANVARVRDATRAQAADAETAAYGLRKQLADYLAAQQSSFHEVEKRYDRETKHGTDLERQTEWFARVKRGLGAVRAGLEAPPTLTPRPKS